MRYKKILLVFIIFSFGLFGFITPARAVTTTITSNKAAAVLIANPDTNYGNDVDLLVGGPSVAWCQTYIEFDISNLPSGINKVSIVLNIYQLDATMDLDIDVASDVWTENGLTWNNKPSVITSMGSISITSAAEWTLELTGIDLSQYGNYITIRLDSLDTDFMYIRSDDTSFQPKLAIDHGAAPIPAFPIGATIGIVVGIIAAAGVAGFLVYRHRKKGREPEFTPVIPAVPTTGITEKKSEAIPYTKIVKDVKKVFDVSKSNRIDLEMLRDAIPMDKPEFDRKILDLAKDFGFRVEVEVLHISDEKRDAFIDAVLNALRK